jgi:hypothetical protein
MDETDIIIIWNRFNDISSIVNEIKELREKCEFHGCEYASIGSAWCNKGCELKELIYILEIKLKSLKK